MDGVCNMGEVEMPLLLFFSMLTGLSSSSKADMTLVTTNQISLVFSQLIPFYFLPNASFQIVYKISLHLCNQMSSDTSQKLFANSLRNPILWLAVPLRSLWSRVCVRPDF